MPAYTGRRIEPSNNHFGRGRTCADAVTINAGGKSRDGVRARVRRHLTSARSDIIANRQIDVWEIAYVMAFPVQDLNDLANLEALLFHHFDPRSTLMQGQIPAKPDQSILVPEPSQLIQVMSDDEIKEKA